MENEQAGERFESVKRVIVVIDLAGFAKLFQEHEDGEVAQFLDRFYTLCERVISAAGGTIVKFMGDGCLSWFPEDQAQAAVSAVVEIDGEVAELARSQNLSLALGANLHLAFTVEGELGAGASRRRDLIGRAVNQTFMLGRGAGVRLSEPVYRQLPSAARTPWTKHKPPAVYTLAARGELYGGSGKSPNENAQRW